MAYVIDSEQCISCSSCINECPSESIITVNRFDVGEGEKPYINEDTCVNCGLCAANCPVDAIHEA